MDLPVYYTYILRSIKDGRLYVGSTADVSRRLWRHNQGFVVVTKHRRPLVLAWSEAHATRAEATQRERHLKSLEGSAEKQRLAQGQKCLAANGYGVQ